VSVGGRAGDALCRWVTWLGVGGGGDGWSGGRYIVGWVVDAPGMSSGGWWLLLLW